MRSAAERPSRAAGILRAAVAAWSGAVRVTSRLVWPPLDLATRLWLAQIFLVSGLLKIADWRTAVDLATHEYPVTWLEPVTAAWLGATAELLGGGLLAAGLLTRYAAVALLALTAVIQVSYVALDSQLFWIVLLGRYAVAGAGPVSVDSLLRRGLARSALPLVPLIARTSARVERAVTPVYLSLVRAWLAATLLLVAAGFLPGQRPPAMWIPLETAALVPDALGLAAGGLLLAGLATRPVAALLLVVLPPLAMLAPASSGPGYLMLLLAVFLVHGGGSLSLDALGARTLRRWWPELVREPAFSAAGLPRIVIVGAGFGGMACAAALRSARAAVTIIDRANYHLFQPLLYQVATAALSPGDIAAPVRPLFRDAPNTRVLLGEVTAVDTARRQVRVDGREVPYDYLVIATGAAHSYFGKDHWAPFAPGLKRIEDATEIRGRLLRAFERAEATDDPAEREALLTFLIVGGGPTGVELAGAIAELARFGMEKEFRNFDPAGARVLLVQSGPRLLPAFPESLSAIARDSLEQLGIDVRTDSRVEDIDADGVVVSGQRITARTVIWAAGVMASPAATWLGAAADRSGRVVVTDDLSIPGHPEVFVIGDVAASNAWNGQPVPGLAPAAKQAGSYAARAIRARLERRPPPSPFRYRHRGSLATIGRKSAVADFGLFRLSGEPAWWLWGLVHVGFLVGLRNRVATMVNWFWAYLTYGGGIRLITGQARGPTAP